MKLTIYARRLLMIQTSICQKDDINDHMKGWVSESDHERKVVMSELSVSS